MGISPDIWGPCTWTFIHLIVLAEKENDVSHRVVYYKELFTLLQELLPCDKCKKHLKENMELLKNIETIKTKRELFDWTTNLHNMVNKLNGKHEYTLDESFALWSDIANGQKKEASLSRRWIYDIILLLIIVGLLLALVRRKK